MADKEKPPAFDIFTRVEELEGLYLEQTDEDARNVPFSTLNILTNCVMTREMTENLKKLTSLRIHSRFWAS